jgi:catechol 2,3-dioxygenase-like lactoylglutathione lyase family enzyme
VTLGVRSLATACAFYDAALAPLGIARLYGEGERFAGYGVGKKAFFWVGERAEGIGSAHVAFAAPDHATVDAFHATALAAGGRDNGAPGLRPHYHAKYYGAFVLDPDGHNIEAVCHA